MKECGQPGRQGIEMLVRKTRDMSQSLTERASTQGKRGELLRGGQRKETGINRRSIGGDPGRGGIVFFFFFFFLSFSFSRDSLARLVVVVVRYDTGIREDGWGYVGRLCERMEQVLKSE